jgi:hypothetical protein
MLMDEGYAQCVHTQYMCIQLEIRKLKSEAKYGWLMNRVSAQFAHSEL